MNKKFFGLVLFLSFAVSIPAQSPRASGVRLEQDLRKHIEYLASDKLAGRRTGEPGATLASKYIAARFAALKLRPGNSEKGRYSFLQAFPYVTGVEIARTGNSFRLRLTSGSVDPSLVRPVGFSPNGNVGNVRIVFAGFGISSTELKFDDYAGLDVRGKIVLVFDGTPDNDNPHSPFGKYNIRTKALIAKDKGAVGVLLISRENKFEDDKLTRLEYDQTLGESALPTFVVSRSAAEDILGISADELKTIEADATAKKDGVIKPIAFAQRVTASGSFSVNLIKKSTDVYNVIGILPGTDPTLKNEAIVVGAHYDHLGHGGQGSLAANSSEIHHGADDNASGTAAVIELARQFSKARNNKRTLVFVTFSGEEEGLLGSNYYIGNPAFPLNKTVAMINLDMVGRLNDDKLTIGGIGTANEWNELVKRTNDILFDSADGYGLGRHFTLQLNEDGFGPSDHSSFYGKKIPVLFFFTGTHADYHKPSDTADKINYGGESQIISYLAKIIRSVDENPKRPTYAVAKSSGITGRTGFNISLGTIPNYADATDGLLLDGVRDDSPAARAGLKAGDKVVRLAGHDVRNVMDYTYVLGEMKAGEEYEIIVLRAGERISMKIIPVKR